MLASWKEIYDAFDGKMKGCTGIACPDSCCIQKEAPHADLKGQTVSYTTSFFNMDEYLEHPLRVAANENDIRVAFVNIGRERTIFKVLVDKCLNSLTGCKMSEAKPITCRIYPFSFSSVEPVRAECPHMADILLDQKIVETIYNVRRLIDYDRAGNLTWLHNANKARESILRSLDGERTLTYHVVGK